jgi:hypothetical protein
MKNLKTISFYFLIIIGIQCKAQSPVIDINNKNGEYINGAYYQDTNFLLNQFEGTYVLNDGVNYLKIVFQKKEMQPIGNIYEDVLIGEYQYKQNNVEKINTLNRLTTTFPNFSYHAIYGNHYLTYDPSSFNDYTTDTFRLSIVMEVPGGIHADLEIRKCVVNGQEAIQIFKKTTYYYKKGDPVPPVIVPNGFFYLIKE